MLGSYSVIRTFLIDALKAEYTMIKLVFRLLFFSISVRSSFKKGEEHTHLVTGFRVIAVVSGAKKFNFF